MRRHTRRSRSGVSTRRSPAARALACLVALLASPTRVGHAACNLIPSATQTFRGALGAANKPFAAPGDFVEVGVQPGGCDVASSGLLSQASVHDVTLVFTPPGRGARRAVVLTADCGAAAAKQAACAAIVGPANVACVDAAAGLALVTRSGIPHLSFRFPDTDALFAPAGDARTLTGPVTIAVTDATQALPCDLATKPCAAETGVLACVDDLYAADGTCAPNPHPTFTHFTALPVPNDYQADCFADAPPCTAFASEARLAVDAAGNLLLPVDWQGVLVSAANVPVPRLLRATVKSPLPFPTPPVVSLGSFTPEGAPLPPIFEPQADPNVTDPNVVTLFGSADASYTILRIARALGNCASGPNAGQACVDSRNCDGAACAPTCVGGTVPPGTACAKDGDCGSGGRCAALFADFRPLVASGGPLVMPRQFAGVCQQEPHQSCTTNAQCTGVANLCVTYAFEARTPVPLESLVQSSPDVFAFSVDEAVAGRDLDGDGDVIDHVVTLQDRTTGQTLPIGAGGAVGRAVTEIHAAPFVFPAVATEDTVAAFLEPEFWQGGQDANGDGDVLDTILRAYRQSGTTAPDATGGRNLAVDAGLLVNERSIAVSGGKVFVRVPEAGNAPVVTERVAVHTTASPLVYQFSRPRLSADGSVVAFPTDADLLPSDTNGLRDVYVRDASGALELVSVTPRGVAANAPSLQPDVSPNGRFVVFETESTDILPGENGIADVFLRDRCVAWGAPVAGCTPTTEKVSLAFDGSLANSSCDAGVVSADGRFVAFRSNSSNLVPVAIPPCSGVLPACTNIFVRDRCVSNGALVTGCSPTTELVSLASDGTVGDNFVGLGGDPASISADGSRIEFVSFATNLVSPPTTSGHVFVHDRRTHTTSVVDVGFDGSEANSQALAGEISADGRYVTFGSSASNVAPPSFGFADVFVRDLATGATERLSHAADGTAPNGHSLFSTISADGRFVAFVSFASNLVPGDTNTCGAFTTPGTCPDVFVADRLTGMLRRASVASDGTQSDGDMLCDGEPANGNTCYGIALSSDGAVVAFDSNATTLLGPGGDTNGVGDTFVRRVGPPPACGNATTDPGEDCDPPGEASCPDGTLCSVTCQCNDVTQDGDVDDTVLEVLDPTTSTVTPLCPAGAVAVTGGMAAFLRPEAAGSAAGCPSGPALGRGVDLDGDGDVDDAVVHLWTGSGAVQNLGLAATAVALSATHVAAIGGSGGTVQTHAVAGGGWADSGEAADALEVCGSIVAFLKPVGDHHVLELWDPATATLTATGEAAEGIVCDDQIVAFRTPEAAAGANLNGPPDADELDDVLQVYDLAGHAVLDTHRAVTPCRLDACDPRVPYRVKGMTVKFLTFEPDQGNTDLNGDGDALDLVLQVYDVATGAVTVVGTPAGTGDPLQGGDPTPSGGGTVYPSSGRCLETLGTPASCATDAACGAGAFCDAGVCEKEQGVCTTTADCPPGIPCVTGAPTVPASPDTDGDGVPDHLDDCPDVPNGDQTDTDHDGVGDACDRATCGNGVVEYDEQCDGAQASACGGGCLPNCRCAVCATGIADPKVKVLVKTRNGVGQLVVKALLPLPAFDAATPVAIRLDDADSTPIVEGRLASVPRQGTRGTKFQYKAKTNGLQKVALKQKVPGTWLLTVKAKRWFTATAANDMAADTRLTVTVGTQCFTHAATLKVD